MPTPDSNSSGSSPKPSSSGQNKGRSEKSAGIHLFWYVLIVLALAAFAHLWLSKQTPTLEISTSDFEKGLIGAEDAKFKPADMKKVTIGKEFITFQTQAEGTDKFEKFAVPLVGISDIDRAHLTKLLTDKKINTSYDRPPSELPSIISFIALPLLVVFLFFMVLRRTGGAGSALSFGRSRGRMHAQEDLDITFDQVAGIDEAVEELREIVEFLKSPGKYQALGGRIPRGVLLVGPPGTGKTLLAKAIAGEAGVPFFSLSGSDFVEMFVGVGAARVRDMFTQAASRSPSIIFIDELDALGKVRGSGYPGGHDEREQTLNALLVEMDGFASDLSVIVLAATNRPETLDPALMRPGRFDRHVLVDRPDVKGREATLKVHVGKIKVDDNVDLKHIARLTPGFVGADLANLVNEAALLAARKNKNRVTMAEFEEGIERVVAGLEKQTRIIPPDEKQRVAYHECGHALVACSLPNTDPVHKVSIIPRGLAALGYMRQTPSDDRHLITQTELESRVCVILGGITTEQIVYNEISTGAQNDLERGTDIARRMVMEFGMSPKLGRVNYRDSGRNPLAPTSYVAPSEYTHSEQTLREIDLEVKRIIDHAAQTAFDILTCRREILDHMARELVEKEVMDAEQIHRIIDEHTIAPQIMPGTSASPAPAPAPTATSGDEKPTGTKSAEAGA